ncbi:PD-(D/E)XK nuclease family protein [Cellvibrio japonicus]|nr:PD-(D/E)XK nuclease family protein [Cellvibrio japonicus]QEI12636.1 hypothetical protein FY117_10640 [Cellvibrio japonicus]QEI16210.1 hypothetical protein FY116_10645 [Cellvibrio japonicus]QEI19788.1 hypothetical protein FY115_10640 [Cellvibrio japonicus]
MTDTYFPLKPLQPALLARQLILTANNRLRNHVLRAFTQDKPESPQSRPRVMTLQQWFEQQWDRLQWAAQPETAVAIASNLQRQAIWQSIIQTSSLANDLLQPGPLAQSADAALRSLELWQLTGEDVRKAEPWINSQSNSQNFLVWMGEFHARLASLNLVTQEQAMARLLKAYQQGVLSPEPAIWLLGFDDIPPLQQQLIATASHTYQLIPGARVDKARLARTQCITSEQEMLAAARWSQAILAENAQAMIGIIVPNLGQCRAQLERAFTSVFEPLSVLPEHMRFTLPFNFSAGIPLGSTPLVAASLELLGLYQNHWPMEDICQLLLSPFWGHADAELVLRSQLVNQLRELGRFHISGSDLRYWAQKLATPKAGGNTAETANRLAEETFLNYLLHLEAQRRDSFGKHPASYWSELFNRLLQHLDWPGERRLDSQEHQQLAQWNQLLEDFAQLDACGLQLSYGEALQHLRQIAAKTPFQAQTPLSPIQILGALEGSGLVFSHCWVMGLHHRQWPAAASPNPLLPINLQRQQQMPHASAERELVFARSLTQHYRQCAGQVVFSCASSLDDQELSPSALIRDIPLTPLEQLVPDANSLLADYWQQLLQSRQLEAIEDNTGPAVGKDENIRGGASIFKEQAACPFNAFARLRLGARIPEAPVTGFSAIERGNMLHNALADLWRWLRDQASLLALDEESLQKQLHTFVNTAVMDTARLRGSSVSAFYTQLEQERLQALLREWLQRERERPAFTVVAIEHPIEVTYAGIPLRLRIDRIDQLIETNELLLIDYKTGHPSINSWFGERPDEPQLPLYALVCPPQPGAIAFAQINAHGCEWKGTGQLDINHPGIKPAGDWAQQLSDWQQHLSRLAESFLAGTATVDFKDNKAQTYAEALLPLNRLPETEALARYLDSQP